MTDMTHEDIERIWNSFSHYLSDRQKSDAAVDFVNTLKFLDVETAQIKASSDHDPKLEEAVSSVYSEEDEEDNQYGDDGELVY
jgi:hypothetical protein